MLNSGGKRNEQPLTDVQIQMAKDFAVSLGMPATKISYSANYNTGHGSEYDILIIGTDLYPSEEAAFNTRTANSRVVWKAALGHELIGHREAALNGWSQSNPVFEEVQASIRAARYTPNISRVERITLLRDAISRLPQGCRLRDIKDQLNISKR